MKTATVLPLLAVGVTMLIAVTAVPMSAVPVPFATGIPGVAGTFDDNLDSFTLVLSGGVVTNNVQTPSPILLGANWPTQLTITLNDANSDFVLLSGNVFHATQPHPPEGTGTVNHFAILLPASGDPSVTFNNSTSGTLDLDHGSHKDRYVGNGQRALVALDIITWSASLTGKHVPDETNSLLLLVSVVAAMAGLRRRFHYRARSVE